MTRQEKLELLAKELFDFDWWNYGLDEVSEAESPEWSYALAEAESPEWSYALAEAESPEWSYALAEDLLKKLEEVDAD